MAQIKGKLRHVYPTETKASKAGRQYVKRDFVVAIAEYDRNTNSEICSDDNMATFTVIGDERCKAFDAFSPDDKVEISFDLRGSSNRGGDGKPFKPNIVVYSVTKNQPEPVKTNDPWGSASDF